MVDPSGDIWVSTGNGSVYSYSHAYDNSDSVLELSPSLKLLQFYAPADWATNNSQDEDMSAASRCRARPPTCPVTAALSRSGR